VAEDRDTAEDRLSRRAQDVDDLLEFVEETSFSGTEQEVASELSNIDQHPADHSDVTEQRARDYTIKQMLERETDQIREARQRLAEGKYGICENCGRPIPEERLRVRPEATLCVDCQRQLEHGA
jgi:RNA polymerase-binding protein DksA